MSSTAPVSYTHLQSFENNAPYLPKTFIETVRAGSEDCYMKLAREHR